MKMKAKQLSLFDLFEIDVPPVSEPEEEPEEIISDKRPAVTAASNWFMEKFCKELPEVTDPEQVVRITSHCVRCKGITFNYDVPYSWLNPDEIYCRFPGDVWMPKGKLPCRKCIEKVAEFLIKLVQQ